MSVEGVALRNHLARGRLIFFILATGVFILDRVSKGLVVASLPVGQSLYLVDHLLWLDHVQNPGAAFGNTLLGPNVFLAVSVIVAVVLVVYQLRLPAGGLWVHVILGLILGGTLGNAYDRLFFGGLVTDFIEVPHWPVFNVADSAISVGAVLIGIGYLRKERKSAREEP